MAGSLSLLIPARNEEWLARTIQDALEHIEGETDIIVVLDGQWSSPGIPQHERVNVIYVPESIGQRAATNLAARLSRAEYVMKVDAHCAFDQGFDVKMMALMEPDMTMVPVMKNLHVFNWVCKNGHSRYQSPSGPCRDCGEPTEKEVVWYPKPHPNSTSYRFDKTLHFQYYNDYKKHQHGHLVETMSLQGSCFMLTRDKYWELGICDEAGGSWGHQGSEVALKTWLSGGRVVCNRTTWYAHLFRTQGSDFSFPWPANDAKIEATRQYFRDIFLEDKWPLATRKLQWLVDKFDAPDWQDEAQPVKPEPSC